MRKFFASLIVIALLLQGVAFANVGAILEYQSFFSFPNPIKPDYTASSKLDKILNDQTVSILMFGDGMGTCSGTIIHEDKKSHYVLTAKHCIDVTEEMYVERTDVLYIMTSVSDDLAVLVTKGKVAGKKVAVISEWKSYIDEEVHHYAYPSGIVYKASGMATRYTNDHQYLNFEAIGGCSGGGIFNSDGELVSVLWGGYRNQKPEAPLKTVAEPLEDVKSFLKQIGLEI